MFTKVILIASVILAATANERWQSDDDTEPPQKEYEPESGHESQYGSKNEYHPKNGYKPKKVYCLGKARLFL